MHTSSIKNTGVRRMNSSKRPSTYLEKNTHTLPSGKVITVWNVVYLGELYKDFIGHPVMFDDLEEAKEFLRELKR